MNVDYRHIVLTHRAHHDKAMWRQILALWLYRLHHAIRALADRVDPWHGDCEWFGGPVRLTDIARHGWRNDR